MTILLEFVVDRRCCSGRSATPLSPPPSFAD
jgi:hypothetical protein